MRRPDRSAAAEIAEQLADIEADVEEAATAEELESDSDDGIAEEEALRRERFQLLYDMLVEQALADARGWYEMIDRASGNPPRTGRLICLAWRAEFTLDNAVAALEEVRRTGRTEGWKDRMEAANQMLRQVAQMVAQMETPSEESETVDTVEATVGYMTGRDAINAAVREAMKTAPPAPARARWLPRWLRRWLHL
jgi:hypothetical protein